MTAEPTFLRSRVIRDAVLTARPVLDDWSGEAGVVRRTRQGTVVVAGTGLRRAGREQIVAPSAPDDVQPTWHLESAVFGGYLYDHYGHFLLESLARLWTPEAAADAPVVWIAAWCEDVAPWMHEILDMIGVDARRHVVTARSGPLGVDELLVSDPGFEFGASMHPWFGARLGRVEPHPSPDLHIWLSRSRRVPISGLDEEVALENALAATGWTIMHPEDLSVADQVELLARAVHVAGLEGSAFHTLALLHRPRCAVDLLTRQEHRNFELVAAATGLDQVRHSIPGATPHERRKTRGTDVQWSGVDIPATIALLADTCTRHRHRPAGTDR